MPLSRRTGQRFQASIWPGFVDAMTGLLLVLMFVLTIFTVVQFVLRETITGQENELNSLASEVLALGQALGLEQGRAIDLETKLGDLSGQLASANAAATETGPSAVSEVGVGAGSLGGTGSTGVVGGVGGVGTGSLTVKVNSTRRLAGSSSLFPVETSRSVSPYQPTRSCEAGMFFCTTR